MENMENKPCKIVEYDIKNKKFNVLETFIEDKIFYKIEGYITLETLEKVQKERELDGKRTFLCFFGCDCCTIKPKDLDYYSVKKRLLPEWYFETKI